MTTNIMTKEAASGYGGRLEPPGLDAADEPSAGEIVRIAAEQAAAVAAEIESLPRPSACRCDRPLELTWRHCAKCGRGHTMIRSRGRRKRPEPRDAYERRHALAQYVRHTERFGTELTFEVAAGLVWPYGPDLTIDGLGRLSRHLRRIDPAWCLPRGENDRRDAEGRAPRGFTIWRVYPTAFAAALTVVGWQRADACEAARITVRTLQRQAAERTWLRCLLDREPWAPYSVESAEVARWLSRFSGPDRRPLVQLRGDLVDPAKWVPYAPFQSQKKATNGGFPTRTLTPADLSHDEKGGS